MKTALLVIAMAITSAALCACATSPPAFRAAANPPAASARSASAAAVPADAVREPVLHVGDTWVDNLGGGIRARMVVMKVGAGSMTIDEWGSTQVTDLAGNFTEGYVWSSNRGQQPLPTSFDPALDIFDFPLYPGKTWSHRYRWKEGAGDVWGNATSDGKVGNWETVTVPAGTFKALRVDVTNRGVDTDYDVTYWYSPKVKRFVKATSSTGFNADLASYHPAVPGP